MVDTFLPGAALDDFRRVMTPTRARTVRVSRRGPFTSDDRGGGRFGPHTELVVQARLSSLGASTVEQELSAKFAQRAVMRLSVEKGTALRVEETVLLDEVPWRVVSEVPVSSYATEEHYVVERRKNG